MVNKHQDFGSETWKPWHRLGPGNRPQIKAPKGKGTPGTRDLNIAGTILDVSGLPGPDFGNKTLVPDGRTLCRTTLAYMVPACQKGPTSEDTANLVNENKTVDVRLGFCRQMALRSLQGHPDSITTRSRTQLKIVAGLWTRQPL